MSEVTRVGIVGAGAISQLAHLPVLSKMRGVDVVAIADNDRTKARALPFPGERGRRSRSGFGPTVYF